MTQICNDGGQRQNRSDLRISFGMIVLNGEPFLRYNLSSIYPLAHEIVVVEGACRSSASVARPDGHSLDGTFEALERFQREEDPEKKITIVTAAEEGFGDGFWPEKDQMSQAYARRSTGNYLWQIDADEFYHPEQIERLLALLRDIRPDMVSFPMLTFWGSPSYVVEGFFFIRDRHDEIPRIFAWGPGYRYATHRPATVLDPDCVDLRRRSWLQAAELRRRQIYMYHYSLLFPKQVFNKVRYYKDFWKSDIDSWEESVYRRLEKPFRAHNVYQYVSWLRRFPGDHPHAIVQMMADIASGSVDIEQRDCADVEALLSSLRYRFWSALLNAGAKILSVQPFYFLFRLQRGARRRAAALVAGTSAGK